MVTITFFMYLTGGLIFCAIVALYMLMGVLVYFAPILLVGELLSLPFVILHERREQRKWIAKVRQENEEWIAKVQQR